MKLILKPPVTPLVYNQRFGGNPDTYKQFGLAGHNGDDLMTYHGQPVYASHDGLAFYEIDGNQGHGVVIRSNDKYEYKGTEVFFKTIYWHLCDSTKEPKFKSPIEDKPKQVRAGDLIGYADNTGFSTGDHLHYGLKPCTSTEPYNTWYNFEQNNGYLGAIDPEPFFEGKYQFTKNLGFGSVGSDVLQLQLRLVQSGFASYSPTGFFGMKTKESVRLYQRSKGIEQTGFVGSITRSSLNK